ncbi:phytoene/squalene synthase family protein [Hellea balneolensis]|uniref:phytoene/squalene synthase family protein n=1 Tax=Hellea balneolensis TaxID=287478 RepID=UPI0003FB8F4C|nr:squalene/phytoene synthase family protein [Hellea balneolensis]
MLSAPTLDQLKSVDPDRLRAAVFADEEGRERLELLYAFHYELAKVPELVSEPMIGQIRYQWWRDAVAEIYEGGTVRQHEITTPLARVLKGYDVPRFWVDRLIDGRERDLDPRPFANLDEAKAYCRQTSGILMQIAVKILGSEPDDAVLAAGEAWGLTGLARAYGYYQNGMLSQIDFKELCLAARDSRNEAHKGLKSIPNEAFPAVAYAALVPKFLSRLLSSKHDPKTMTITYGPLMKQLRLLGAAIRGNI